MSTPLEKARKDPESMKARILEVARRMLQRHPAQNRPHPLLDLPPHGMDRTEGVPDASPFPHQAAVSGLTPSGSPRSLP